MRNLFCLLLFITFVTSAQTKMSSAEITSLTTKVKERAATTTSILSDFTQKKHLDFLSNDIITKGVLTFKAPDLVKWEYTEPFNYAVIFKDKKLYINDEGKKSDVNIGSNKMFKQLNNLIIRSVTGNMFDENEFNIEYFTVEENSLVYFIPKDTKFAKFISAFHIVFNNEGDVLEVKMIEPSGDYSNIIFSNKELNKPIQDAVFTH